MRCVTFNISAGRALSDGRVDVDRFAQAIAALDADVLSLQEVDRGQQRSGGADLTRVAAAASNAEHAVFAPALYGTPGSRWEPAASLQREGPAYGCALISRLPLVDVQIFRIPAAPLALPLWVPGAGIVVVREEPRVAIIARVEIGTGDGMTVIGTHLPFVPGWKRWALRRVVDEVRTRPDPLLLMGDLNLQGRTPARLTGYQPLGSAPTFPAYRPRYQLDHVLLRRRPPGRGFAFTTSTPQLPVSDHRPVVVDIEIPASSPLDAPGDPRQR